MGTREPEVLVVGAGPTGLLLAAELTRHGVGCRVIEATESRAMLSKALGVQPRTLEVFDAMGVIEKMLEAGTRIHGMNAYADGKRIVHVDFDDADTPYPFVLGLPQCDTERILEAHLATLGVKVERGVRFVSFVQGEDGVTSTLARTSAEEMVRTRWVVGCDGAHSTVRHALGLSFEGAKYDEEFLAADVAVAWARPHDEAHVFLSPSGLAAALPLPDGRWRVIFDVASSENPSAATFDDVKRTMHERGDAEAVLSDARWVASFRIHRRIVPSYRRGRAFLAGDAAHIHSPAGGQGMNTGLQDAYNLAWKLALVARGEARDALLDSYDVERRPIAAATLGGTDLATRVVTLRHPVPREIRDRLAGYLSSLEIVQSRLVRAAFELTVSYRKSPIVAEDRSAIWMADLVADRSGERPSLRDWIDFGAAPGAGDRVPDVVVDADGTRLHEALRGTSHTLLLFDGAAATEEGYARFERIRDRVAARWGARVRTRVVLPPQACASAARWPETALLDREGAIHRRFGAGSECVYLVRPDGYVGYRSQPADEEKLAAYLETLFV